MRTTQNTQNNRPCVPLASPFQFALVPPSPSSPSPSLPTPADVCCVTTRPGWPARYRLSQPPAKVPLAVPPPLCAARDTAYSLFLGN